ncbi:MAG: putative colanic acid biosynthesis acetyltransferase [Planctomycetaceae bacterium]|nr:putative colanic acid biosynthesis acetyltransferase [Planctomycetaceae bacterium]
MSLDLSGYRNQLGWRNKLARAAWGVVWVMLFRPSPRPLHGWRRFLLRRFGATVGRGAHPYPLAWVWAPWNLEMGDHSCLADGVDCYSVALIRLGRSALVSQRTFLCGATHDYNHPEFPLVAKPITIADGVWVAAEAFIGPGVTVGEGAVVGARACVTKDVEPWTVVAGNPAIMIKRRLRGSEEA